jgi:hypothetical protein
MNTNFSKIKSKLKQEELLGKITQISNGAIHRSLDLLVTTFMQSDKRESIKPTQDLKDEELLQNKEE